MKDFRKYKPYSIRLKYYDYSSPGEYFITICTQDMRCVLGEIIDGEMVLNKIGKIMDQCWLEIPKYFSNVELDIHQVMPNHLHGIIRIICNEKEEFDSGCRDAIHRVLEGKIKGGFSGLKNPMLNEKSLSKIVRWFKGRTTFEVRNIFKEDAINGVSTERFQWQSGYYDEIINNEKHYNEVYDYILSNPSKWDEDKNNPKNFSL